MAVRAATVCGPAARSRVRVTRGRPTLRPGRRRHWHPVPGQSESLPVTDSEAGPPAGGRPGGRPGHGRVRVMIVGCALYLLMSSANRGITIFHYFLKNNAGFGSVLNDGKHDDIWNSIHMDILVCTSMYKYVPVCIMLVYVFACIGMYQYIKRRTDLYRLVLVCTCMYFS